MHSCAYSHQKMRRTDRQSCSSFTAATRARSQTSPGTPPTIGWWHLSRRTTSYRCVQPRFSQEMNPRDFISRGGQHPRRMLLGIASWSFCSATCIGYRVLRVYLNHVKCESPFLNLRGQCIYGQFSCGLKINDLEKSVRCIEPVSVFSVAQIWQMADNIYDVESH